MRRFAHAVALAAAGVLAASPVAAQTVRAFTTARQAHGDTRLTAVIDYAAGALTVTPGTGSHLYRLHLAFDPTRFQPLSAFDASTGTVRLGAQPLSGAVFRVGSPESRSQNAVVELSPRVDLSVQLDLGAVEGAVELGGLRVSDLRMRSGASRTTLRFSRPNAIRCGTATIEAGAADLTVVGLGNSRCEQIAVEGGVGKLTLDFGGEWRENAVVSVRMTVGELVIRLPRSIGIQISLDRFLAAFQPAGLERRGNSFVSPGYDAAARHLDISLATAVGGIRVEWID